ncbi:MAG TPA: hypothetical protein VNW53_13000 [Phenylobacterium sp.]|uniref:hypothetical protein n=1 Tax=Phenylobacterium sp. TaxID=1871053 RepID=UPI002B5F3687|nr:hypothetical protein [Phenylobacterium sp.]HXA39912.1 hypothetical protein [Phenylobacterium sp.]
MGTRQVLHIFNIVMRIVSSLLGLLMMFMGSVWILQGLNLYFRVGFMVGDKRWVAWGALLALVGLCQLIWSNTRQQA